MNKFPITITVQTIAALALTEIIALATIPYFQRVPVAVVPPSAVLVNFLLSFAIATLILLVLLKIFRGPLIFGLLFSFLLFTAIWFLASLIMPNGPALAFAAFFTLARLVVPVVIISNLTIILGIAGISALVGAGFPWPTVLLLLLALSIYDYIAVYKTGHMVTMFKNLLERGVILALIIPEHLKTQITHLRYVKLGEGFFFLGTGDLALPTIFAVSAYFTSPRLGIGAAIGSLFGLLLMNLLFILGRKRPLPALPPIALGTVLGFLAATLI